MIHQLIETIEFVLGSVSNTASYLRLWALSLAHSQLAATFLSLLMGNFYKKVTSLPVGIIGVTVTWGALAVVTTMILLLMDSMECFLHKLRLHWVEFQNKFFKGDGKKYLPFGFDNRKEN